MHLRAVFNAPIPNSMSVPMLAEVTPTMSASPAQSLRSEDDAYDDGYLRIEHQHFYVAIAGRPLYDLARKEFFILSRLAREGGRAVRSEEVWQAAWGDGSAANLQTLRVHIATLRRKLAPFGLDVPAVVHFGYRLARHVAPTHTEEAVNEPHAMIS